MIKNYLFKLNLRSFFLKAILLAICILFINITAYADKLPLKIKAQDLKYNDEQKIVIASGDVRVIFEDIEINAANLIMDTSTNQVTASGEIAVSRNGIVSKGKTLYFDIKTKDITIYDFDAEFHAATIAEPVFMHAQDLISSGDLKYGHQGRITTCDQSHPHYWISALEFWYYPDEKIEGFNVFYNFSFLPVPVFYTPYYQFQLGKRKIILLMPVIGENPQEGFFIRTESQYFIDNETEGAVYLDHLAKKGVGRGFKHTYHLNGERGSYYLYNVNETVRESLGPEEETPSLVSTNYVSKFEQQLRLSDNLLLNVQHNYKKTYLIPSGRKDDTDFDINLGYEDDWRNVTVQHRFNLDYMTLRESLYYQLGHDQESMSTKLTVDKAINPLGKSRYETLVLAHKHQFAERWRLELSPKFYQIQNQYLYPNQRLDLPVSLIHDGTELDFYKEIRIDFEKYYDTDEKRITSDINVEHVDKLPLTTLTMQTLDMDLFNVDNEFGVGTFHEAKFISSRNKMRRYTITRYTAQSVLSRDIDLPLGTTLTLKRLIRQASYHTGDKHYKISDTPSLKTVWWDHVEHDLTYIYTHSDGNSPIYYEAPQLDRENRMTESLRFYYEDAFSWRFSGGKDLETNIYDDLLTDMQLKPFGRYFYADFNYGWSFQQELWRDFVAALNFTPNYEDSWKINYVYDFNKYEYKSAGSILKFHLGTTWWKRDSWQFWTSRWAFSVEHIYDPLSDEINLYTLGVYKDLHCWTAQFNYTKAREEWIIAFSLKAFPDEPLSLTKNNDGFSIDAFRQSLENPEVSRQ